MKTTFAIVSAMFIFASISSCTKQQSTNNSKPYYQFTVDDKSKLMISHKTGDEIIYKNQNSEEIKFTVVSATNGKIPVISGSFWDSYVITDFYYDEQQTIMEYAEGYAFSNCEITLKRYPVGSDYNVNPPVVGTSSFTGYLRFPLWNSYTDTLTLDNTVFVNFNSPVTSLTINGRIYSKVRILESGKTDILEPNNLPPALPKNVNKIYYDENFGIVGFNDVNGKMWRLE